MHVMLNGEPTDLPGPMTIAALLERLGIDGRMVAVEYNLTIIKRARYAETTIEPDAEIEIVAFVGGG
ncbi:MAG TPA: sulfur carrier protein ThiS [Vicinamibacterales bacterium]|jgi:thiamine biosynthesis protein ThiS|nr:sulfur carrier protein ThiS [Vicinamibacterales bacterium]